MTPLLTAASLDRISGLTHGFFTRKGGVSAGLYRSLNCGRGSADDSARVEQNRARAMAALGLQPDALVTLRQVHGKRVILLEDGRDLPQGGLEGDALVSARSGVALGILTADCAPVLLCDPVARVVGAAHAGWKGALHGVLEATVEAMAALGAEGGRIVAAVGPCIAAPSYEVGPEFPTPFHQADPANAAFFSPAERAGHHLFDLGGYVVSRLAGLGLGRVERLDLDTCARGDKFFSYRRATHHGQKDYGRVLSAIGLIG